MATTFVPFPAADLRPAVDRHVKAFNRENVANIPHIEPARRVDVSTITTAAAVTYTPAQLIGGHIQRNPAGAARADLLPTPADMLAAMPGAFIGQSFEFVIQNDAGGAFDITLTGVTGAVIGGNPIIAQNNSKRFMFRWATISPPSYGVRNRGTFVT